MAPSPTSTPLRAGDRGLRRVSLAMFSAGFATFALLYASQPLMPLLVEAFDISPAASSLSLAVVTATLGLALLPAGWAADAIGRKPIMTASLSAAAVLGVACAVAPSYPALLALRALQGVAIAGVPAVAMAYLAEEVHPDGLGRAVGLYIGGNGLGGMSGRLIAGVGADVGGWRLGLAGVALLGLVGAVVFARALPPSTRFSPRPLRVRRIARRVTSHLTEPGLLYLNAMGALLTGTFVAVYNGIGFRLAAAPYHLGHAAVAAVFLLFPIGSASSATAGRMADRLGRRAVLPACVTLTASGLALTAAAALPLVILGVATLTAGFFAGHSVASSWVGRRAPASASQASSLYLSTYYAGSSAAGPLAGAAWSHAAWSGVLSVAAIMLALALLIALRLRGTPPIDTQRSLALAA